MEVAEDTPAELNNQGAPEVASACALSTTSWSGGDGIDGLPLRLPDAEVPFVYVIGAAANLKLSSSVSASRVPVRFSHRGVVIDGGVPVAELPLSLRRPVVFEGFVVPKPGSQVSWRGSGESGLVVGFELIAGVAQDTLKAEVSCGDLTLTMASFELDKALPKGRGRLARFESEEAIALSITPGGPPVAFLDSERTYDEATDSEVATLVRELSYNGSASLILWDRPNDVVFGWIDGRHLYRFHDVDEERDSAYATAGVLNAAGAEAQQEEHLVCARDVPLTVRVSDGPEQRIGAVKANTPMLVDDMESVPSRIFVTIPSAFDDIGFREGDESRYAIDAQGADCKRELR